MAVYPKVAETMADALGCDVEDVKPDVSLIEGLDAESIDFLDMVFRLERAFKVKIPRGKIVENARGDLPGGRVRAERHRDRERARRSCASTCREVPAERFKTPMKVADIPRLFTPTTFCKLVVRAQKEARGGGVSRRCIEAARGAPCARSRPSGLAERDALARSIASPAARARGAATRQRGSSVRHAHRQARSDAVQ